MQSCTGQGDRGCMSPLYATDRWLVIACQPIALITPVQSYAHRYCDATRPAAIWQQCWRRGTAAVQKIHNMHVGMLLCALYARPGLPAYLYRSYILFNTHMAAARMLAPPRPGRLAQRHHAVGEPTNQPKPAGHHGPVRHVAHTRPGPRLPPPLLALTRTAHGASLSPPAAVCV